MSLRAPDWLDRLTGRRRVEPAEPGPGEEIALLNRFAALAAANGISTPPLEVEPDPRGRLLPARVDWTGDEDTVVVSHALVAASPAEQTWHLAACLGWWTSPEPRLTRFRWRVAGGLAVALYVVVGLADLVGAIDLSKLSSYLLITALSAVMAATVNLASRRQVVALEAAGRSVLRAAGHEPASLCRLVFGRQSDPSWYRRPLARVPAPSRRLAAGGAPDVSPARPLF